VPKYKYEKVNITGIEMMPQAVSMRTEKLIIKNKPWNVTIDNKFTETENCELRKQMAQKIIDLKCGFIDGAQSGWLPVILPPRQRTRFPVNYSKFSFFRVRPSKPINSLYKIVYE
jgi:hypothetical protein